MRCRALPLREASDETRVCERTNCVGVALIGDRRGGRAARWDGRHLWWSSNGQWKTGMRAGRALLPIWPTNRANWSARMAPTKKKKEKKAVVMKFTKLDVWAAAFVRIFSTHEWRLFLSAQCVCVCARRACSPGML